MLQFRGEQFERRERAVRGGQEHGGHMAGASLKVLADPFEAAVDSVDRHLRLQ